MALTDIERLYFLAFDHRGFFERELAGGGDSPIASAETILDAKRLILEGVRRAGEQLPGRGAGILVDDQYGAELVPDARRLGVLVAMPAERSERELFELHHGERFAEAIVQADPDITKVLVRYNVQGDREGNAVQAARLRELSDWLAAENRTFLLELLVEPTAEQLARAGDVERFERALRPPLIEAGIGELQDAGVEPGIWKVEGLDDPADARAVAAAARRDGREHVVCVVLGSGAPAERVESWLRAAAGVDGFVGFAIGRSIWWDPLKAYVDGKIERSEGARRIAENYLRFIHVYERAEGKAPVAS